jgi:hypothetical protein
VIASLVPKQVTERARRNCLATEASIQSEFRSARAPPRQMIAKLIEVDLATGAETDRLTFNSNAFPAVDGYHVQQVGECGPSWKFDFKAKAYYIEATLTQTPIFVGSAAGIQVIKIDNNFCSVRCFNIDAPEGFRR